MSLFGLLKLNSSPLDSDIEEAFDGNLCRCTGYRPILESARSFSKSPKQHNSNNKLVDYAQFKHYDPNDDIPFPQKLNDYRPESFYMYSGKKLWLQPVNTEDLLIIKDAFHDAKLISGNTEVGIETKFKGIEFAVFVNVFHVNELKGFRVEDNRLEIGANITLTELAGAFQHEKKSQLAMDNMYYRYKSMKIMFNCILYSVFVKLGGFLHGFCFLKITYKFVYSHSKLVRIASDQKFCKLSW
jgi:xanthine dehydrogenase/oxidase